MDTMAKKVAEKLQTQTTQHTIKVDFAEKFPIILGDEDRLIQVINNLIQNAIKYSPDGGDIIVSGQVRPTQVIICVRDEGPGIAIEDIPHIFDRFYRASEASKTTKGAGLGLYLTKAVIEAHKGRIWVDPKPGDGARICFSLPRDE
jgi:signal transduction histidine kinase